jgi:hypothetical protein
MRKKWIAGASALVLVTALSACGSGDEPAPSISSSTTKAPDVSVHQSGPESPIAYGLQVPKGATQLGPLVRFRSAKLIAAYMPQLNAAIAQQKADAAAEAAENGTTPKTPAPPNPDKPYPDTFKLLKDDAPRPDSTISVMRVDGDPSDVTLRMISQIAALLPTAGVKTRDLPTYCTVKSDRITGCSLTVSGLTKGKRDLRVSLTVDPGNLATRTSPPSAETHPVMTVLIEYIGDPRKGQAGKESDGVGDIPNSDKTAPPNDLIWPKMDLDAPATAPLLDGKWVAPDGATILLSGFHPGFVALATEKNKQADLIAEEYARSRGDKGQFTTDVVEDLNEVSTTYTAVRADGSRSFATYLLSARGNYAMLFNLPAPPKA